MARYEGMDELLQRVRERLGVQEPGEMEVSHEERRAEQYYTDVLENILLVVRDSNRVRNRVNSYQRLLLSAEQREELCGLMDKAVADLRAARELFPDL